MGTVAGAEPSAEVTSLADWHTTQMCADACYVSVQVVSDVHVMSPLPASGLDPAKKGGIVHVISLPSMTSHSGFFTRSSSC